jgi:hypothetical protein
MYDNERTQRWRAMERRRRRLLWYGLTVTALTLVCVIASFTGALGLAHAFGFITIAVAGCYLVWVTTTSLRRWR